VRKIDIGFFPCDCESAAIELCLKYQRAKVVAMLSDTVSVPVQRFEKSFLFHDH
jgi:hypothetical protein